MSSRWQAWLSLLAGPLVAGVMMAGWDPRSPAGAPLPEVSRMAAIALWMAIWWVTEAVPIAVTALLPLVLLPITGLAPIASVSANYGRPTIFLFLGGFLLAFGIEASGLHRRLALAIVARVGSRANRLVLGFMAASWLLSMWMSNTSTVMLMLPIALSVLKAADIELGTDSSAELGPALMLGIAYASNIGGMATLIGTPPNMVYAEMMGQLVANAPPVTFLQWLAIGLPISACFIICGAWLLTRVIFRLPGEPLLGERDVISRMREELGPIRRDEWLSGLLFALTALLWVTGGGLTLGAVHLPGWQEGLGLLRVTADGRTIRLVDDGVVAIAMACWLFVLPSADRPGERLLEWAMTRRLPWGILLLFGGGFALADGFGSSGLSAWAGQRLESLSGLPVLVVVAVVCVVLTMLTELTSNTATTTIFLPILAAAATAMGIDARLLLIPATLSASCAFMMPVASPTQAIVFGSEYVTIRHMVRAGIWFNVLGVALVTAVFALLAGPVLGLGW